jgi:hypothetical protein
MNICASTTFWIYVSYFAGLFLGYLWGKGKRKG